MNCYCVDTDIIKYIIMARFYVYEPQKYCKRAGFLGICVLFLKMNFQKFSFHYSSSPSIPLFTHSR